MHKIVRITYVVAGNVRLSMLVVGQFVGYLCCMLSTHVKDGKSAPQWQCVVQLVCRCPTTCAFGARSCKFRAHRSRRAGCSSNFRAGVTIIAIALYFFRLAWHCVAKRYWWSTRNPTTVSLLRVTHASLTRAACPPFALAAAAERQSLVTSAGGAAGRAAPRRGASLRLRGAKRQSPLIGRSVSAALGRIQAQGQKHHQTGTVFT